MASARIAANSSCIFALLVGQAQGIRQFEHMHWPGITVELRRKRQTHAAARPNVADSLLGQSLDRPCRETAFVDVFPQAPTLGLVDPMVGPTWGDLKLLKVWLEERRSV
jgi:hypothetical protein